MTYVPRCVQRSGKECRDCVECLSKHPEGKTCADCVHGETCKKIWGVDDPPTQHYCGWVPSRFSPAVSEGRRRG